MKRTKMYKCCKMKLSEWFVQVCLMWHVIKIIKTHGEILSKENIFQLQKDPAVNRYYDGDVIKNIPKICYNYNDDTHDYETAIYSSNNDDTRSNNNTANILNVFESILQQIENTECEHIEQKTVPEARAEVDFHLVVQPPELEQRKIQYELQPFSILQQLRRDEQKLRLQEQQKKQQLKLQQQQNVLELQQVLQHINAQNLGKADKKKKKRKRRKRKKKKKKKEKPVKNKRKKQKPSSLLAHPAQILFTSPTQKPQHYFHQHDDNDRHTTTEKPFLQHPLIPMKKIKYILRKNTIFKKKKKEYLNHLKHLLYPFIKFIAFFTIINPFTLAVFLFSLISPVVLGFVGFIGLSFFIKPALNFLFGVRHTVNTIKRRKLRAQHRRQRLRDSRRPITIHKHYYQQTRIAAPPGRPRPHRVPALLPLKAKAPLSTAPHHPHTRQTKFFNPLLPDTRQKLKKDNHFMANIKGHDDSFERY